MAEPTRIRILRLLASGEKSVTELSTALGAPMVNTSHHLSVMRAAHVLAFRKDGRSALDSFACEFEVSKMEVVLKGIGRASGHRDVIGCVGRRTHPGE